MSVVHDGELAVEALSLQKFDLLILDINLPKLDGFAVLRQIRPNSPNMPVLVLTTLSRTEDRVRALDTGADDCMNKPFSFVELSARVRALLRRGMETVDDISEIGDLRVDRRAFRAERAGKSIPLTAREFCLLEYMARHPHRPVTRPELMENVWKHPYDASTNLVDVYVKYVRDKVDGGFDRKLFRTMRGVGYVLSDQ